MRAKIIKPERFNAMQPRNKETVQELKVCAVIKGEIEEIITVRFYMSRSASASVVYCCLWVRNICSGKGTAGGWGYHRSSAALAEAIRSAGIELYGSPYHGGKARAEGVNYKQTAHIGGCGDTAMRDALTDIARDICGARKVRVL